MNQLCYYLIPFIVCLGLSLIAIPYIIRICNKHDIYDQPNGRKVHQFAIPRLGGLIFMPITAIGMLLGLGIMNGGENREINIYLSSTLMVVGAVLIYLIGLIDDLRGIKATEKFIVQTIAAILFPSCNLMIDNLHGLLGLYELPFWLSYVITVFTILLIVNAMNLIDGIDGLSASLAMIILLIFAYLFWQLDAPLFVLLSLCLCATVLGFFIYNYFGIIGRNKIFMGDTGSLFIGFVIAYLAIKYQMENWTKQILREEALLISLTLVFLPCIDVVRVALFRLKNHHAMFQADKTHIHHLIMNTGLTMHQTLYTLLVFFVMLCVINWGLHVWNLSITCILAIDIAIYSAFVWSAYKIGETR